MDVDKVADALFAQVSQYVARALQPIQERLQEIEELQPIPGPRGAKGDPGKKGEPGTDGTNVTMDDVLPVIEEAVKAIPPPKDGKDGKDATDDQVQQSVTAYLESNPIQIPKDGDPGKSVTIDDIRPLVENVRDAWALDFERSAQARLQQVLDNIEKPKDGKDGFSLKDFCMSYDGERTFTFRFEDEGDSKECSFKVAMLLERGIYRAGQTYERGDGVTFGGSYWIAQWDGDDKPGTSDMWRLAVKKGRDGKDKP